MQASRALRAGNKAVLSCQAPPTPRRPREATSSEDRGRQDDRRAGDSDFLTYSFLFYSLVVPRGDFAEPRCDSCKEAQRPSRMKSSNQSPYGAPATRAPSACTPRGLGGSSPDAALATSARVNEFRHRTIAAQDQPLSHSLLVTVPPPTHAHPPAFQAPAVPGPCESCSSPWGPVPSPHANSSVNSYSSLRSLMANLGLLWVTFHYPQLLCEAALQAQDGGPRVHCHPGLAQQPACTRRGHAEWRAGWAPGAVSAEHAVWRAWRRLLKWACSADTPRSPPPR